MAHGLPIEGSGDFGRSPIYGQLSDAQQYVSLDVGAPDANHNRGREIKH